MLEELRDIPIVGDVRGDGYFHAIELVKDQETKEGFTHEESEWLLRGFLSGELYKRGLICRADDRGDPVIQFSPPLIVRHCRVRRDHLDPSRRPDRGRRPGRGGGLSGAQMLTVSSLLDDCGLELAAGSASVATEPSVGSRSPSTRTRRPGCRGRSSC